MAQQQIDPFGVTPEGVFTTEDLTDIGSRMLGKDAYIGRLRRRILDLEAENAALREQRSGDVVEQAEQVANGAVERPEVPT